MLSKSSIRKKVGELFEKVRRLTIKGNKNHKFVFNVQKQIEAKSVLQRLLMQMAQHFTSVPTFAKCLLIFGSIICMIVSNQTPKKNITRNPENSFGRRFYGGCQEAKVFFWLVHKDVQRCRLFLHKFWHLMIVFLFVFFFGFNSERFSWLFISYVYRRKSDWFNSAFFCFCYCTTSILLTISFRQKRGMFLSNYFVLIIGFVSRLEIKQKRVSTKLWIKKTSWKNVFMYFHFWIWIIIFFSS